MVAGLTGRVGDVCGGRTDRRKCTALSKGPRQYTVVKVVRMTAGDAEKLALLAKLGKMSESEVVRMLIRRTVK